LVGPGGSGKSMTALRIGKGLGKRIAVIDSERGSASKYAGDVVDFDLLELENYAPRNYVDALRLAEREGYDVVIVDSLSHAWSGKGGALEMVDQAARRSRSQNTWQAWRDVTPEHNALIDALLSLRAHVIVTMRTKTEWVTEVVNGKTVPRRIGTAPIQRDGIEYEMDVVAELDWDHVLTVSKTRCPALDKAVIREPGEDVAALLMAWLSDGAPIEERPRAMAPIVEILNELYDARENHDIDRIRQIAEQHWGALSFAERQQVKLGAEQAQARIAQNQINPGHTEAHAG
jgi:hypothetical protein